MVSDGNEAEGWGRELRKGLIDLALLCHLSLGEAHGYALIASLKDSGIMAAEGAEATVYQALQRLAKHDLASSAWTSPEADGRPRKMYSITRKGRGAKETMRKEWKEMTVAIDELLERSR